MYSGLMSSFSHIANGRFLWWSRPIIGIVKVIVTIKDALLDGIARILMLDMDTKVDPSVTPEERAAAQRVFQRMAEIWD